MIVRTDLSNLNNIKSKIKKCARQIESIKDEMKKRENWTPVYVRTKYSIGYNLTAAYNNAKAIDNEIDDLYRIIKIYETKLSDLIYDEQTNDSKKWIESLKWVFGKYKEYIKLRTKINWIMLKKMPVVGDVVKWIDVTAHSFAEELTDTNQGLFKAVYDFTLTSLKAAPVVGKVVNWIDVTAHSFAEELTDTNQGLFKAVYDFTLTSLKAAPVVGKVVKWIDVTAHSFAEELTDTNQGLFKAVYDFTLTSVKAAPIVGEYVSWGEGIAVNIADHLDKGSNFDVAFEDIMLKAIEEAPDVTLDAMMGTESGQPEESIIEKDLFDSESFEEELNQKDLLTKDLFED